MKGTVDDIVRHSLVHTNSLEYNMMSFTPILIRETSSVAFCEPLMIANRSSRRPLLFTWWTDDDSPLFPNHISIFVWLLPVSHASYRCTFKSAGWVDEQRKLR
jgi:hypothetical protein